MPRFRPDLAGTRWLAGIALLVTGCSGALQSRFAHPEPLVGAWVDVAKTTATDTSLWLLGAGGDDRSQHVRRDSTAQGDGAFVPTRAVHYGYWYLAGTMSDTTGRAICFTNRPGRSAPSCISFALDTVMGANGPRRRLRVHGYAGAHSTGERELIARDP